MAKRFHGGSYSVAHGAAVVRAPPIARHCGLSAGTAARGERGREQEKAMRSTCCTQTATLCISYATRAHMKGP